MNILVDEKLKVACIGTGYFSQFHYEAWRRIERVQLSASLNRNIETAQKTGLPAYNDLELLLREIEPNLLDIITPPETHLDFIRRSLGSSVRTIICQKPFCRSLEEAKEAISLCERSGIKLIVHENFRFQPWYRVMKAAIDRGLLGDVHQMTFRLRTGDGQGERAYLDRQPYFQLMTKFLIHETGVHWIDTFRYLLGEPVSVYADLRKMNPVIAGEDAGYFIMEFEGGKRALFDANRHLDHDAENCRTTLGEALLEGTRGTISLNGAGEVRLRGFQSRESEVLLPVQNWKGFAGDCVHALQSHVISCIFDGGDVENLAHDYVKVLAIEEAVYRSAETGKKVLL